MDPEDRAGVLVYGVLVVREPGTVCGPDLPESRAGEGEHFRDAESAPDLDQLAARDDHLGRLRAFRRDDGGEREQRRPRTVVDDERILGAGQLPEQRHRVIVARTSSARVEIVLQVGIAGGRIVGRQSRPLGEDRSSQISVEDHACCVDYAPETSTGEEPRGCFGDSPFRHLRLLSRDDLAPQATERLTDGRRRRRTAVTGGERPSRRVAHHGVYRGEAP